MEVHKMAGPAVMPKAAVWVKVSTDGQPAVFGGKARGSCLHESHEQRAIRRPLVKKARYPNRHRMAALAVSEAQGTIVVHACAHMHTHTHTPAEPVAVAAARAA
eukprot:scaffold170225_cov22-Tisochrysis_lutea.AAC.1